MAVSLFHKLLNHKGMVSTYGERNQDTHTHIVYVCTRVVACMHVAWNFALTWTEKCMYTYNYYYFLLLLLWETKWKRGSAGISLNKSGIELAICILHVQVKCHKSRRGHLHVKMFSPLPPSKKLSTPLQGVGLPITLHQEYTHMTCLLYTLFKHTWHELYNIHVICLLLITCYLCMFHALRILC